MQKTSHWGTPDSIPGWNMLSMLIFSKEFDELQMGWSKDPGPSLARMFLAFFCVSSRTRLYRHTRLIF